jgi:FkbM family methyltransferase
MLKAAISRAIIGMGAENIAARTAVDLMCRRFGCSLSVVDGVLSVNRDSRSIRLSLAHLPYCQDMAQYFDTYFSQVEPERIGDRLVVDYSHPKLHRLANELEFELTSFPEELPALDSYFRYYRPRPGETVFDIGAYCGVTSHLLSKEVGPAGRVIAFEPDPENFPCLVRNIERHGLANVSPVKLAISDKSGTASFNSEGALGSGLSQTVERSSAGGTVTVETISIEGACSRYGAPSFVKIDAEGAEIEILSAAKDFLRTNPINFALDTNHWRNGAWTFGAVESIFRDCGYTAISSNDSRFYTTWGIPRYGI